MWNRSLLMAAFGSLLLMLPATGSIPQRAAHAFSLDAHDAILFAALPVGSSAPTDVDAGGLGEIMGSFWTGAGNRGSDRFQADDFRHFDSANSPMAVCARANRAWSFFVLSVLDAAAQVQGAPSYDRLANALAARGAFGGLTHSLQDFYSHSNWLELGFRTMAPLFPTCDPALFPADLQTGYFKIGINTSGLLSGCPRSGPPAPFRFCHLHLNKDKNEGHGADPVPGMGGTTYHKLASDMARAHTAALYSFIRTRIEDAAGASAIDVSRPCVSRLFSQWSWHGACIDISGRWIVSAADPVTGLPPLGQPWIFNQPNPLSLSGAVLSQACGQLNLSATRSTTQQPFGGTVLSCPEPVTGPCPAQISLPLSILYAGPAWTAGQLIVIEVAEVQGQCVEDRRTTNMFELRRVP